MRESEKKSMNGVIWYILGVVFVLVCFPLDIAVVSILILSWADTSASTFGRLWGKRTRALPRSFLGLPFAPRKSLAGFVAASLTGALTAAAFWGWFAPSVNRPDVSWTWMDGFSLSSAVKDHALDSVRRRGSFNLGGWVGLGVIGVFAGFVSGVAEALDLGSVDDNLSLPVISGTCLYGLFRLFGYASS
jgi:diacylglycerol kinase (CTP)